MVAPKTQFPDDGMRVTWNAGRTSIKQSNKVVVELVTEPLEAPKTAIKANASVGDGVDHGKALAVPGKVAAQAIEKIRKDSNLFTNRQDVAPLTLDALTIKTKLGEGGFSEVHECELRSPKSKIGKQDQALAIKFLKSGILKNQTTFESGAADLATEAEFLACLDHPHIIKLHAVTAGCVETNFASGKHDGYFLVVDRLADTMDKRIKKLAAEQKELLTAKGTRFRRRSQEFKAKRREALNDRLKIALQVAEAMKYLHGKNVMFRDLKPDNIGFDENGNVRIFDFGLAKEAKSTEQVSDGKYKMTGNSGTRRYMAPEVAKDEPYGLSVDIYSFGILLWELCALEQPFFGFCASRHARQVIDQGDRPPLDSRSTSWFPPELHRLLESCWTADASSRVSFEQVVSILKELITDDLLRAANKPRTSNTSSSSALNFGIAAFGNRLKTNLRPRNQKVHSSSVWVTPAPAPPKTSNKSTGGVYCGEYPWTNVAEGVLAIPTPMDWPQGTKGLWRKVQQVSSFRFRMLHHASNKTSTSMSRATAQAPNRNLRQKLLRNNE